MIRSWHLALALLLVSTPAFATVGGPNSFEPLGVDEAGRIHLRESVGGESGEFRLWILDPARPAQPTITPLKPGAPKPPGLKPLAPVPFAELSLTGGEIVRQSLHPRGGDALLHRFDLRVTVRWKSASATVELVAYRNAQVMLAEGYAAPGGSCAVALVTTLGKPEETGYDLQQPVMVCAGKSDLVVPARPDQPKRPPMRTR